MSEVTLVVGHKRTSARDGVPRVRGVGPVALRFHQYAIALDGPEREYVTQVLEHHAVQAWTDHVANAAPAERAVTSMTRAGR